MQLNSLTIEIKMASDGIAAYSVELLEGCVADTADHAISALMNLIESRIVSGEIEHNDFVVQMIAGGDKDEFNTWLEDANYQIKQEELEKAFFEAYPKANTGMWAHMNIPSHDWEDPVWDNFRSAAYDGLIGNGPSDSTWINYVQKVCAHRYFMYVESQRNEIYKQLQDFGLPVLSKAAIKKLFKEKGWNAFNIEED